MTHLVGNLSLGEQGIHVDVFEGAQIQGVPYETVQLPSNDDVLDVQIIPFEQNRQPGRLGYVELAPSYKVGCYIAAYDMYDVQYRRRGIISAALAVTIQAAMEQDVHFETVELMIRPDNQASIKTAQKVGARLTRPLTEMHSDSTHDLYEISAQGFLAARRKQAA